MESTSFTNESEVFQHYQVLRRADGASWELGRGSMGVTYKAFDTDLHCEVALKVILPQLLQDEASRARFLREARLAARLRHPNIAAIFHLGETADGACFYAMEFCEGETLQQIVEKRGPFDMATTLNIVLQVCRALVLANEHQLVHRDIKPANLILTDSPEDELTVKVIDFGLAKSSLAEASAWASTGTSGFVGTAYFASPEQLENESVDGRSDIYSLGVTLWFLLTGRAMFTGSLARIISQHLAAPVPWQQLDEHDVPPVVRALLGGMLEKKPVDRFPNALKLKRAVEECLASMAGSRAARRILIAPAIVVADAPKSDHAENALAGRWQLGEKCGGGRTGQLFRAADLRQQGAPVAVKVLAPRVATDAKTCQQIERAVQISQAAPHENLILPLAFGKDGAGGRFLVMEWIEGFTLLAILRARGAVTLQDALRLLEPMAAGFDHARQHGIARLELSKHQVLVHFPEGFEDEQQRERVIHLPIAAWPPFRVVLGTISLEKPVDRGDETFVGGQTYLPEAERGEAQTEADDISATGPDVAALGRLIYELLGGPWTVNDAGPARSGGRYAPLARLTEEGNAVVRRAMRPAAGGPGFRTGREFYEALAETAGHPSPRPVTVAPVAPVPLLTPAAEPDLDIEEEAASGRRCLWLVVPLLLALAGLVAFFALERFSPPVRVGRASPGSATTPARPAAVAPRQILATPAATPAEIVPVPSPPLPTQADATPPPAPLGPTMPPVITDTTALPPVATETPPLLPEPTPEATTLPEVAAAAPLPAPSAPTALPASTPLLPLEGKLEHGERSPLGDLRVEYRKAGGETSVWFIPEADEARRQLLDKSSHNVRVLFSPDEQWVLFSDRSSGDNATQLYRRTRDGLPYEVPEALGLAGDHLGDLAWRFYLGELGLPADTNRNHVRIDGVEWQPKLAAFTLRLVPADPEGLDTVPVPWMCRYNPVTGQFEAVTDPAAARAALAARDQSKTTPPTATPLRSPRPGAEWRNTLGAFVEGFVRCDQTRDVPAALAFYGPVVDYFGDGRINQARIRSDILAYNQRWPVQQDSLVGTPDIQETKPGQSYTARFHMAYYVASPARKAWARGESALEMSIAIVRGVPLIVSIREKTVRREKGTLPDR